MPPSDTTTKERPILFSAPMIRAILEGRKTQTRRIVKLDPQLVKMGGDLERAWPDLLWGVTPGLKVPCADETVQRLRNPWGFPEPSRLWVRETHAVRGDVVHYRADDKVLLDGWKPSIFMLRAHSRLLLEVTKVRVERLQDISEDDAKAEGVKRIEGAGGATYPSPRAYKRPGSYRHAFEHLWDSINGDRTAWSTNPWVWCVSFKRIEVSRGS